MDPQLTSLLVQIFAPSGVAALAIKLVLNGSKERIKSTEKIAEEIRDELKEVRAEGRETRDGVIDLRERFHNHEARLYLVERLTKRE